MTKTCTQPDCVKPHKAKGLCTAHYQQQAKGRLGVPRAKTPHGSFSKYNNQGCRCDPCRLAWNKYCADRKRAKVNGVLPPHMSHGKSASYQYGCRCALCKQAHAAYAMERRGLVTADSRKELEEIQGGKCACCFRPYEKLVVDHVHGTKHVRGLLCHSCNTGIGKLGDDLEGVMNAVDYLKRTTPR